MTDYLNFLLHTNAASLPSPASGYGYLHGAWAVVMAAAVAWLAQGVSVRVRMGLAGAVAVLNMLPGPVAPAYWLGLAFQAPSLLSAGLALAYLVAVWRGPALGPWRGALAGTRWSVLGGVGVALGWVLLLDTLAWWPVSVYAWGFGTSAVAVVLVVALLAWVVSAGREPACGPWAGVLGVLALFVLTRWPNGNVWDALLDPWLWAGLQGVGAFRALRWVWRRGSAATHA